MKITPPRQRAALPTARHNRNVRRHGRRCASYAAVGNHLPTMWDRRRGDNVRRRVHLLLRVQRVSQAAKALGGRLLRLLFLWER